MPSPTATSQAAGVRPGREAPPDAAAGRARGCARPAVQGVRQAARAGRTSGAGTAHSRQAAEARQRPLAGLLQEQRGCVRGQGQAAARLGVGPSARSAAGSGPPEAGQRGENGEGPAGGCRAWRRWGPPRCRLSQSSLDRVRFRRPCPVAGLLGQIADVRVGRGHGGCSSDCLFAVGFVAVMSVPGCRNFAHANNGGPQAGPPPFRRVQADRAGWHDTCPRRKEALGS
jgi:hypothetical protein